MTKRVLVVDDERCIANTLAAILCNAGYEAAVAYNGESALYVCESFMPELVISDIVMPGANGITTAMKIKERYPLCKVLLFSANAANMEFVEEAGRGGYNFEILTKPIHPTELLAALGA